MNTTEPTNTTDQPSPLNRWIIEHGERVAAVKEACAALARHLSCLPDPQNESETKKLLHWRYEQFRLPFEHCSDTANRTAASAAAEVLDEGKSNIIHAARGLLAQIENLLSIDARANRNGLFSPTELPQSHVITRGGDSGYAYLVSLSALPADHPLRAIGHDPRVREICVGRASMLYGFDGMARRCLEPWMRVSAVKHETEAARAEMNRREAIDKELAEEQRQRLEAEKLRHLSPEQRQIASLERQVAEMRGQLAARA